VVKNHEFEALEVVQGSTSFYLFRCKASLLWSFSKINKRQEDKDEGYQRVLSESRVRRIRDFIVSGNAIPGAVIIGCDDATFSGGSIKIPQVADAAWIIDGQHRCAGAHQAAAVGHDVDIPVVAFLSIDEKQQTDYFVTINREAKGVPTSLYLDLLKRLPRKTSKQVLEERVADISNELSRSEESVFFQRVVSTTSPKPGQVSLTNFARRVRPLLNPDNGILGSFTLLEQQKVIENYFRAIEVVFPKAFKENIFFKTLGFGAVWKAFPLVFSSTLSRHRGFTKNDVQETLSHISDFDILGWKSIGSGSQAENQAGSDMMTALRDALEVGQDDESTGTGLAL